MQFPFSTFQLPKQPKKKTRLSVCLSVCTLLSTTTCLLVCLREGKRELRVEGAAEGALVISISFGVGLTKKKTQCTDRLVPKLDLHKGPKKKKNLSRKCAYDLLSFWVQENLQKNNTKGNKSYDYCGFSNYNSLFPLFLSLTLWRKQVPQGSDKWEEWAVARGHSVNFIRSWWGQGLKCGSHDSGWGWGSLSKRAIWAQFGRWNEVTKKIKIPFDTHTHTHISVLNRPLPRLRPELRLVLFINKLLSHYCYYNFFIMLAACAL